MSNISVKFNIEDKNWLKYDKNIKKNLGYFIRKISKKTEIDMLKKNINIEISVLLTNNDQIRELNKNYCQKNKATNILAFPLQNINLQKKQDIGEFLFDNNLILGDLVLSLKYIKNESGNQNKKMDHHLKHLLLHGLLHLIGYNHIDENDRNIMEDTEIKILKEFDIGNPYEENSK